MRVPYFEWDLRTKFFTVEQKIKDVTTPCLLLPNLLQETKERFYCCMNKDQKVLLLDGFEFI